MANQNWTSSIKTIINTTTTTSSSSGSSSGGHISHHPAGAPVISEDESCLNFIQNFMGVWLNGSVCLIGLIGNVVSFLVLVKAFGPKSSMAYVLRSLSVADSGFLSTTFAIQSLVNVEGLQFFHQSRDIIQKYGWPLMMIFQMVSVWLTVLVSWERYVAVCKPLQASLMCSDDRMRRIVIIIFSASAIFNVPRFFEYTPEMEKSELGSDALYRYLYSAFLYACVLFVVPLLLISFLNINLVIALRENRRCWSGLKRNQPQEQKAAKISLAIVAMFLLCGTPSLAINIVDSIHPRLLMESDDDAVVVSLLVSNFLLLFNSASNIFIYSMFAERFTRELQRICNKFFCRKFQSNENESNAQRMRS